MLMSIDYFQYGKVSTIPKSYLEFKLYKKEAFSKLQNKKGENKVKVLAEIRTSILI